MKNDEIHQPTAMTGKFSKGTNIKKLEKEVVGRNTKTMALPVMTLTTSTCKVLVHTSKMSNLDWPTGLA